MSSTASRSTRSDHVPPHSLPEYPTEVQPTNEASQKKAKIMIWTLAAMVLIGVTVGFSVGFTRGKKYMDVKLAMEEDIESSGEGGAGAGPLRSVPTASPTRSLTPTAEPTSSRTYEPTAVPTSTQTYEPTVEPTYGTTYQPTSEPTYEGTGGTYEPTYEGTGTYEPTTEREAPTAQLLCVRPGFPARECGADDLPPVPQLELCCPGLICDLESFRCVPNPEGGGEFENFESDQTGTAEPTYEGTGEPTYEGTGTYEPTYEGTGTGEPTEEGTGTYEPTYEGTGPEEAAFGGPQLICAAVGQHATACGSEEPDAKPVCCAGLNCMSSGTAEGPVCVAIVAVDNGEGELIDIATGEQIGTAEFTPEAEAEAAGPQEVCAVPGEHSVQCRSDRPDAKAACCAGLVCIIRDGVEGPICVPPEANEPEQTYSPTAELTYYPTAELTYYPTEEGTYAPTTEEFAEQVQGGP